MVAHPEDLQEEHTHNVYINHRITTERSQIWMLDFTLYGDNIPLLFSILPITVSSSFSTQSPPLVRSSDDAGSCRGARGQELLLLSQEIHLRVCRLRTAQHRSEGHKKLMDNYPKFIALSLFHCKLIYYKPRNIGIL